MAHAYVGTSGWNYKHWRGLFYPAGLKQKDEFQFFTEKFDTVELNNPFYKLPEKETFKKWKNLAPAGFTFAVKANRFITHMKKLNHCDEAVARMLQNVAELGKKGGPILFQLPPNWKFNEERFSGFLSILPKKYRYTFELRNTTWYNEQTYRLLQKHHCAFCIYELSGHISPVITTTNFVYIRLHGPGGRYQGDYTGPVLKKWASRVAEWLRSGMDVYVYFDNDQSAYSAFNALRLKEMIANLI
jgi:uncharacterized protein YecE (DUF72 family)